MSRIARVLVVAASIWLVVLLACVTRRNASSRAFEKSTVAAEIRALGDEHPWAGIYGHGEGLLGETLCVAPCSGFFSWGYSDVSPGYPARRGLIVEKEGHLFLTDADGSPRYSTDRYETAFEEPTSPVAEEYVPVTGGTRHYLIPVDLIARFCADVERGDEPRRGSQRWLVHDGSTSVLPGPGEELLPADLCRRVGDSP